MKNVIKVFKKMTLTEWQIYNFSITLGVIIYCLLELYYG